MVESWVKPRSALKILKGDTMQRIQDWVSGSHALGFVEVHMVVLFQQLGRMDVTLIDTESRLNSQPGALEALSEAISFDQHLTQSYLWVLGAYELIRTLNQRLLGKPGEEDCRTLKQMFNRLRIPLAKMEPAGKYPSDSAIAYPMWNTVAGAAWQLNTDVIISRRELADELLAFGLKLANGSAK